MHKIDGVEMNGNQGFCIIVVLAKEEYDKKRGKYLMKEYFENEQLMNVYDLG